MSGWTTSLLTGLAGHLADNGVGVWHPDGTAYASADTGIVLGAMPAEPERAIVLAAYPVAEDLALSNVTVGVQVRTRAGSNPCDVQDLDDAVWEQLHGAERLDLGGVLIAQIYRRSSASLGQSRDDTGQWERVSNYYIDAMRPSARRLY